METHSMPPRRASFYLRWAARFLSILSFAFLLMFFIGELLFPSAAAIFTPRDIIGMLFFPIGVSLGMIIAWRAELIGSAVTIGSLAAFYATLFAFDQRFPRGPYFLLVALPGFVFLAAWSLKRIETSSSET